jgi:hypothetical protein
MVVFGSGIFAYVIREGSRNAIILDFLWGGGALNPRTGLLRRKGRDKEKERKALDKVAHSCNPSYLEGGGRRTAV